MATYKTPGVYVEEISKFPPSVAQVETAIPAFIGYTEKAAKRNGDDLTMVPTRITSLLEYETYFGGAAEEDSITVEINDVVTDDGTERTIKVNQPTSPQPFLMYYSLQLYFANGGGPCYIVSVGDYEASIALGDDDEDLLGGLAATRKEDEVTLILFPDAKNIGDTTEFYNLYNAALAQCNALQDRFTIIDTETDDEESGTPIDDLRDNITSDKAYTKYGAAYYPYLETILDYNYNEGSITVTHTTTSPKALQTATANLGDLVDEATATVDELRDLGEASPTGTIADIIEYDFASTYNPANTAAFLELLDAGIQSLQDLSDQRDRVKNEVAAVLASINDEGPGAAATIASLEAAETTFEEDFDGTTENIDEILSNLETLRTKLKNDSNATARETTVTDILAEIADLLAYGVWPTTTVDAFDDIVTNIEAIETIVTNASNDILDTNNGEMNGRKLSAIETLDNASYNEIIGEINRLPITLPPSSAMAGIYARTDANVGVWKAPANTSLNYVIKPSVQISSEDQASLNVDTVAGKSVNAIRTFRGKGTLVWGARTLAGNDNEWRYIPVRRFFNMVEESVSKATEQFVFESNDANTWVKVRAMIENFLILQWKAGALAGSKPEQAFYVRVGLGQTMTSQDVLEGRMIIEIGMAAVRPAEFIILRFSHKMQEA